jgi:hypothetical protein
MDKFEDDNEDTLKELVMDERKFLHDISNHIVVAHGMTTFVHKSVKSNPAVEPKEIERLEKALEALNKMTIQLKERRSLLHELS